MKTYEKFDNDFVAAARDGLIDEIRRRLAAGADPNLPNVAGGLAICQAAEGGFLELVELLLASGAHPNPRDTDGDLIGSQTALIAAASGGHDEIVERLLQAGADVNVQDRNGQTALIWAASYGRGGAVRRLLEAGADTEIRDELSEATAIELAKDPKVIELLISHGADPTVNAAAPAEESGDTSPGEEILDRFFGRAATWDLVGEHLTVFDTVSRLAPRIVTMDSWPGFVFQSALGDMPVRDFCRRTAAALFHGNPPEGLDAMLTDLVSQLHEEGLLTLSNEPFTLPLYLEQARSQADEKEYRKAMAADGFAPPPDEGE